ncbi:Uncharacterized protein Adt_32295 [Abeliophyllum distichum]|uniref:Uncharacterized protein n=1 Tax=Abeliophyllum distichum TaxID=126358 RepID=A0ABD1QSY4_9LAMI
MEFLDSDLLCISLKDLYLLIFLQMRFKTRRSPSISIFCKISKMKMTKNSLYSVVFSLLDPMDFVKKLSEEKVNALLFGLMKINLLHELFLFLFCAPPPEERRRLPKGRSLSYALVTNHPLFLLRSYVAAAMEASGA